MTSETGSVIDAPATPRSTRVAFYVFERVENDEALIVRFIGYGVRVLLQNQDDHRKKVVRYDNHIYPLQVT